LYLGIAIGIIAIISCPFVVACYLYVVNEEAFFEGAESLLPLRGTVEEICDQALGGIRSGMFYVGAKSIEQLQQKAQFVQLTQAALSESHPHNVLITNAGKNY